MNQAQKNKAFIVEYLTALSGIPKTPEMCDTYMTDKKLKEHILFFDSIFPGYEVYANEMTAEGDRVVVLAQLRGTHKGEFAGIPPTYKEVDMPFSIGYTVKDLKITDHWLIADQAAMMEQLGSVEETSNSY